MTNYLPIAEKTKPECINCAHEILENLSKSTNLKNIDEMKTQIEDLNTFLYTYFLITYNKDLSPVHAEFSQKLALVLDPSSLKLIARDLIEAYSNTLLDALNFSENEIIDSAIKIINEEYSDGLHLEELAEKLHLSKNYLCSLFKEETGFTFCQYLNTLKTNKAKELLKEDKKTLEYISYECGFSSQPHFTMTFKKYTGKTPREYKLSLAEEI
ncbi:MULTISPECIES: AraC family transcriptional regulator [Peptoniphilus]|jgi:two-component response regulator|uniref:helix-turn-helix domain-containing protein n=1 Tax=Peptoniphilus TaxID=162289 RepID=UPI00028853A4|nr:MULTISPECIES: AraC family transcriptional regulator [Peptoniphilus]MBS6611046.1 helix-turn-helix transcriptional regulator [Peptoniphilus harei]MDU1044114.1 AraC family transcriptional regulator [Peptoniphilus rhinitidis]MDU1955318.1 AraC family transcriptional regulator [Peptoniphilus lacydonensis]MDU2109459.1 AraC family transcriptional regulator [Peptoniphilus lacydonensis]MDU2114976.1 AraC family transcriptional regulator [Peptoniphilus lacydonensis]